MAEKWIKKATENKGALRKKLGIAKGKTIPASKLALAAAKAKKTGNTKLAKEVVLAKTLKTIRKK